MKLTWKKLLITIILLISFVNTTYAQSNLNYLYFYIDENSQTSNKVSYEIKNSEEIAGTSFKLNLIKDKNKPIEICEKKINMDSNTAFKKITCEIPKELGEGEYIFNGKIIKDEIILDEIISIEYILEKTKIEQTFITNEQNTQITINIAGNNENLIIKQTIPKEVIESLTEKNKKELITSSKKYTIIEEDPLIAWNIEKAPAQINYTINKKITPNQQENFRLEANKQQNFTALKYIITLLIILIIGFTFKPLLHKKK